MSPSKDIMLDFAREGRTGLDEAVFCAGKTVAHLEEILRQVENRSGRILLTRLEAEQFSSLPASQQQQIDYEPLSRTGYFSQPHPSAGSKRIAVVAAGTSDAGVAREAARTLAYYGESPAEITDVGVAGLWRLLERLEEIRTMKVVIAVAGMDAALPTVMGGLLSAPVIGVPTSVGYGAVEGGQTALKAMLSSCSPGLTVTNIDNGYGAACAALRILRLSPA
ncbi:MAG TPA: nickel pincer cofactor biosynthesis protein LarB [Burkholderiales bacterium]|nr:nickel pincer cofactor biosynthesis protein LarB [Burkholderiales bacterium]